MADLKTALINLIMCEDIYFSYNIVYPSCQDVVSTCLQKHADIWFYSVLDRLMENYISVDIEPTPSLPVEYLPFWRHLVEPHCLAVFLLGDQC